MERLKINPVPDLSDPRKLLALGSRGIKHLSRAAQRMVRELTQGPGWKPKDWQLLLEKYNHTCLRCKATGKTLVPDHIVPLIRNGRHDLSNIQPLCIRCNIVKGTTSSDYRPETSKPPIPIEGKRSIKLPSGKTFILRTFS
jgi:5-methylcytosine-specific restriction endonuclease McrA